MRRAKITVIGKDYFPQFNSMRTEKVDGPCPRMEVGDVFYTGGENGDDRPEGFCPYAWNSIRQYAMIYAGGGQVNYADLRVGCCNDGIRPVSFLIEAE